MPNHSDARNARNKTTLSLSLAILIIIMDMSGLAGLAAQDELDERQEARSTLSGINIPGFQKGIANSSVTFDIGEYGEHACAILSDGEIYCWGEGDSNRLGRGNQTDSTVPVPVDDQWISGLNAVSLSLGGSHNCALFSDSNVYCWGSHYPVGGEYDYDKSVPQKVGTTLTSEHHGLGYGNAVMVESGLSHSCAILDNGTVQCWGHNYYGQLGVGYKCTSGEIGDCGGQFGSDNYIEHPHYVNLPIGSVAVGLNLWYHNTCIIIEGGDYYCMGNFFNSPHPTEKSQSYQIVAAESHSAITSDGEYIELYSLGWDDECVQIYTRDPTNTTTTTTCENTNYRVFSGSHNSGAGDDWDHDNMFIMHNGSVGIGTMWEYADSGHGVPGVSTSHGGYLTRAWIELPVGLNASAVAHEGQQLACVAYDNGSLQCWGNNNIGQVGDGTTCNEGSTDGYGNLTGCTDSNWAFYPRWVQFPTGLHLTLDEMDDDGDGIVDITDRCPSGGATGWTSTPSTDYDSDGCRDSDEDDDDDNDGFLDSNDAFPTDGSRYRIWDLNEIARPGVPNDAITVNRNSIIELDDESYSLISSTDSFSSSSYLNSTGYFDSGPEVSWAILAVSQSHEGYTFCGLLSSNSTLACFGEGSRGSLGLKNSLNDSWSDLVYPELPDNSNVKRIYPGWESFHVSLENGDTYAWGNNYAMRLRVGFNCGSSASVIYGCVYGSNMLTIPQKMVVPTSQTTDWSNLTMIEFTQSDDSPWGYSICALKTTGEVICHGPNYHGLHGDGTNYGGYSSSYYISTAILPNNVTDIAIGYDASCALLDNGSVYCFGHNDMGQMGDGTICSPLDFNDGCNGETENPVADEPAIFPDGRIALQIWAHHQTFTALLDDGTKWRWGSGYGATPSQHIFQPTLIKISSHDRDSDGIDNLVDRCGFGETNWTSNSSNDFDSDGCLDSLEDLDDDNDDFSDIMESLCNTNSLDSSDYPLDTDSDGVCNSNDDDDDGDGILDAIDDAPLNRYGYQDITLGAGFHPGAASDNVTFAAITSATCFISVDDIYCWGYNEYGQIGDGTDGLERPTPVLVNLPESKIPVSISEGYGYHFCSVMSDGSMYCWGQNWHGQLGVGTRCLGSSYANNCNGDGGVSNPTLVQLPSGLSAKSVSTGQSHTCSILSDDRVYCWGKNYNGQLGIGNMSSTPQLLPIETLLPAGKTALSVTTGMNHNCAVMDDFSLYCWGDNQYNATGGSYVSSNSWIGNTLTPIEVSIPNNSTISMASAGNGQTCAITTSGLVYCWGYGALVQQSAGTTTLTSTYSPVLVNLSGIEAVTIGVGDRYACALLSNSNLYCWGNNDEGQIGIGLQIDSLFGPTIVTMPNNQSVVAISVSEQHVCALLDDNSIVCWGYHGGITGIIGTGNHQDSNLVTINNYYSPQYVNTPLGVFVNTNTRDMDGDGIFNHQDQCPNGNTDWTSDSSTDYDNDGCQDSSEDLDDDNDYLLDTEEDANNNGVWDSATETNPLDADTDDDGFIDSIDDLPLDSTEWLDTDSDGIGNNADNDDDDDGWADLFENMCGTNPLDSSSIPNDFDGDGDCDEVDSDDDNDGTSDSMDAFPFDSSADADTDGDGMPDTMFVPDITQIPVDGLIGYWNFDDSSGNPIDSSGESHVSTAFGNLSYGEEGHANDAIQFDGDGDYVEIEANDVFNVTNITISVWVKLEDLNVNPWTPGSVICRGNGFEEVWCIDLVRNSNNTYYRFWHRHSDLNWTYHPIYTTTSADVGWNHILVTYDGTVSKIYFNGILESSTTAISGALSPSNESVYIATRQNAQSGGLPINDINATIDELRIYNRALNNSEIQLLYEVSYTLIEDHDDDNDGWTDVEESECGTSSLNSNNIPTDTDLDGYCNVIDAFPLDPNEWEDSDGDGVGDNSDIFPEDPTETTDTDGDGIGDNIDPDADNDGWNDSDEDVCLTDWLDSSSVPGDIDSDGICDALETDLDNDGWSNANETACGTDMNDINSVPLDTDGDMICDLMDGDIDGDLVPNDQDVFPLNPLEWYDFDGDGIGDNADPDDDNDGCMDVSDDLPFDPTECDDTDGDGTGNNVDDDDDGDGVIDVNDPFPLDGAATVDTDGDGLPDFLNGSSSTGLLEDNDDDNDGYNDSDDAFPLDLTEWLDTDGDGIGNNADVNDDGDNCPDVIDAFPLNPAECFDTDGDGIGNNADSDDDNDGWLDGTEMACGTSDPLNASSVPDDFDSDGVCDLMDFDDDNDSIVDASDAFPFDPCASVDTDGDGLPDELFFNCNTTLVEDWDDDNDGYNDTVDLFPQDANEWSDFDMDGFGDNMDTDDDGDMVPDDYDLFPLNSSEWADNDGDGIGDNADLDDDNDGTEDLDDDFPLTFGITTDTDGDGLPDNMTAGYNGTLSEDLDDDGDGVLDIYDQFPLDATEWSDTDLDGIGNNADSDDDGDGWSDNDEWICGTDTLDANDIPDDSDDDGICDSEDDEDLTTLTGRAEFYLKSPVTVWMALVGIIAGMIGGATSTSFRARKERNQLYNEMRDFTDSVRDNVDYTRPILRQPISVTESKDTEIKNLVDQGYSQEVAEALFESQR